MIREEYGEFYRAYSDNPIPIYIYGTALDGVTFAKYLKHNNFNIAGFIDGKSDFRGPIIGLPIFKIYELEDEEYYVVLSAKTQSVALEMLECVNKYLPKSTVFGWKAWCVNPSAMNGNTYCSIVDFPSINPWMYCAIYGKEKDKSYYEQVYLPPIGPVMRGSNGLSGSYYCLPEYHSKYWNIDSSGRRIYKPVDSRKKIVFVGDSRILGIGVEDCQTIPAFFQDILFDKGYDYSVENYSVTMTSLDNILAWIDSIEFNKGDILCFSMQSFLVNEELYNEYDLKDSTEYYKYRLAKLYMMMRKIGVAVHCLHSSTCESRRQNTLVEKTYLETIKIARRKFKSLYFNKQIIDSFTRSELCGVFDIDSVAEKYHLTVNFYVDRSHYTAEANKLIAQSLYEYMFNNQEHTINHELCTLLDKYIDDNRIARIYPFIQDEKWKDYKRYLYDNRIEKKSSQIGSIVMNANPFSKGHQYLIEYASKIVDYLYVFVVEEDCSEFSFDDRYKMVKMGTAHFSNVRVMKGGSFIISQQTFPEYFDRPDTEVDTSKDLGIFSQLICPILGIKYRFVGKEPYSTITRGYNNQMKKILPLYGVECVEIDRVDVDGEVISATKIRKAIVEEDDEMLRKMLPDTSYEYVKTITTAKPI